MRSMLEKLAGKAKYIIRPMRRYLRDDVLNVRFYTDYNNCNYNCEYCIAGQNNPNDPRILAKWDESNFTPIIKKIAAQPYRMNIRIGVGGEFFLNKMLVDGARFLSNRKNIVSVNLITNLSFSTRQFEKAFRGFDISKIGLVASYHPTQIKDRDQWLQTARDMNKRMDLSICTVAYSDNIDTIMAAKKELNDLGFHVFVQAYIGEQNGKTYPGGYTEEERKKLRKIFYSRHDYEHLANACQPGLCNAGYKSFYVDLTGTVRICGMDIRGVAPLGNILTDEYIQLNDGPMPCTALNCLCDTENVNTVMFEQHYRHTGNNQHLYEYKFQKEAQENPWLDEWEINY